MPTYNSTLLHPAFCLNNTQILLSKALLVNVLVNVNLFSRGKKCFTVQKLLKLFSILKLFLKSELQYLVFNWVRYCVYRKGISCILLTTQTLFHVKWAFTSADNAMVFTLSGKRVWGWNIFCFSSCPMKLLL